MNNSQITMENIDILPKQTEITEEKITEMIEEKINQSKTNKIEEKNNEEINEIEDDDEEEKIIQRIREQRILEMRASVAKETYGAVVEVTKADWKEQVTEIGNDVFVVVHIYEKSNVMCNLVNDSLTKLANRFKKVKFVRGNSLTCFSNYLSRSVPTVLIYKNGDLVAQFIGKSDLGGNKFSADFLEWKLGELNIIETKIKTNPIKKDLEVNSSGILINRKRNPDSEDDND